MRIVLVCHLLSDQIVFQSPHPQHEDFSTWKSLQPVVGTECKSLYKTGKTTLRDLIKIPLGHFSFYFYLMRCMHWAWNASVWNHCSPYTLYFESIYHFPHNCNCKVTECSISRWISANTVNYFWKVGQHMCPEALRLKYSFFDIQSLQNT